MPNYFGPEPDPKRQAEATKQSMLPLRID